MTPSKQRILVATLIVFGVLAVGFFGVRTFHAFREFRGHRPPPHPFENQQPETDVELIRDWMTIPFISRMYHVPPDVLFQALRISPHEDKDKSLKQLNDEYFPEQPGIVEEKIKAAVSENLPPQPPTPPTASAP